MGHAQQPQGWCVLHSTSLGAQIRCLAYMGAVICTYHLWAWANGKGSDFWICPMKWSVREHRAGVGLLPHFCWFGGKGPQTLSLRLRSPGPPLQGESGQMGSVFDKEPLHPCFNVLLLYFKSSTVFFKCWNWQLRWSLATLNNHPFKWSRPNPASVESCDGAHRGGLSAFHHAEGEVIWGAPRIPEGRIQHTSYTAFIMPVSQGGFTNWGRKKKFTLVGFLLPVPQGLSLPKSPSSRRPRALSFNHAKFCSTSISK